MKKYQPVIKIKENENLALLFGEPLVFHCNHYNLYLQRTIEDAGEYINSEKILKEGAVIVIYSMLRRLFESSPEIRNSTDRLKVASDVYSYLGFGLLPLDTLTANGGSVRTPVTHYSFGWIKKWGKRTKPVDFFTCGYIQAALAIANFRPPGFYSVQQTKCLTLGDNENEFVANVVFDFPAIPNSPGMGVGIKDSSARKPIQSNIQEDLIVKTLQSMPIVGNAEGLIPAFGVFLTRHFANYYNYISYETEKEIFRATGEPNLARDLFVEAGHNCAFYTFGGIMTSEEWYGLIYPQCKTREDWVSGIAACVNALGWGKWTVESLVPNKSLVIRIDGGYESNGYLGLYPKANIPKSYLATGAVAGILNLLYKGDICTKPALTEDYYAELSSTDDVFFAAQKKCRSQGDDYCEFVAER